MSGEATGVSGIAHWRAPGLLSAIAILSVGALAGLVRAVLIAPLHVPLDPNEGWNAYHAIAAIASGNPYPPPSSFMTNNYPPLSFYIVGMLGSWTGDNVVAGRFVSLASFVVVCVCIAAALRGMRADLTAGVFAAALFAATLLLTSDYVGMNDPQLLGHALQLTGLLLLLRSTRTGVHVVASAGLFVAGGFVKHSLFALPLASLLWLAVTDGRNAVRFASVLLALSLAGFIAVDVLLGVNLLRALHSPRVFSAAQSANNFLDWFATMAVPLCGFVWLLWRHGKEQADRLLGYYATISIVSGMMLLGGAGVDVNAMFDADIALALCAGLVVSLWLESGTRLSCAAAQVFAMLCIVPFAVAALGSTDWRDRSFWLQPLREDAALASRDIAFLRDHPGPAICEDLTFCYWAGKAADVDVFNLDQQFETRARDPAPFLRRIGARDFASVELDETSPLPFPRSVARAFLGNYRLHHQDDEGAFFVPR